MSSAETAAAAAAAATEVDQSIFTLLKELEAMNGAASDNAVYIPQLPTPVKEEKAKPSQQPTTPVKEKAKPSQQSSIVKKKKKNVWELKPAVDSPCVSWTEAGFQYIVQNPNNRGNVLLKIQMYNNGCFKHSCGLYLNEKNDSVIYGILMDLVSRLENLWVDRNAGTPRIGGLKQCKIQLPAWRRDDGNDCTTSDSKKRKRSNVSEKDGSECTTTTTKQKKKTDRTQPLKKKISIDRTQPLQKKKKH